MKKQILTILTCLASITVFAQTTEISANITAVNTATVSKADGSLIWKGLIDTKFSATITDTLVTIVDEIGKETKYRVLVNGTGLDRPVIKLMAINDLTGKFWNIVISTPDNDDSAIGISISDMEQEVEYLGRKL
jgi:hypothetical protein